MKVYQSQILVLGLTGLLCLPVPILAQSPRRTSSQSPGHSGVNKSAVRDIAPDFFMIETPREEGMKRENLVTNRSRTYDAFTVSGTRLFVSERKTRKIFEARGLPLEWRPFSDLAWKDDQTLVFDRWSQPHYGVHYALNVRSKSLVSAAPFADKFYREQQQPKRSRKRMS